MRARFRLGALATLVACGIVLVVVLYRARTRPPLETTFTSSLQVLGTPAKLVDRAASRVLPVGELDEKSLGDVYRRSYDPQVKPADPEQGYCNQLLSELTPFTTKSFPYRVYVIESAIPNAAALPGGVLLVTRGMFGTLHSESELLAVLAHEIGHVELGHCFDAVRFELLARKLDAQPLGGLADLAARLLLAHTFSKTVEHAADEYSFALMRSSHFDPRSVGSAFRSLKTFQDRAGERTESGTGLMRDYFTSHPPVEVRADEYAQRAEAWWEGHRDEQRYVGRRNLEQRIAMTSREWSDEWVNFR